MARKPIYYRPPYNTALEHFCTKCRTVKPRGEFYRNKTDPGGLSVWCKSCLNTDNKSREDTYYRKRRDSQALAQRKRQGSTNIGPVKARYTTPPSQRRPQETP